MKVSRSAPHRRAAPAAGAARRLLARLGAEAAGHRWTMEPWARSLLHPPALPAGAPWTAPLEPEGHGPVRLSGTLHTAARPSEALVIVIHGLGGDRDSHYVKPAARAVIERGIDCLRLNLRGADGSGDDLYHAGLTDDVSAALRSPALGHYAQVGLMGFSLGGHLALCCAADECDARVGAVAAICPPLDLDLSAQDIDSPARWPYRRYLLAALKRMYAPIARKAWAPLGWSAARRVRRLREWDARVVAPRHGFTSAEDYYRQASVGPRLPVLRLPALLVEARHDPMVLARSVRPALTGASRALEVRWIERAGHLGFAPDTDLGEPAARGLEAQVASWLDARLAAG